MKPLQLLREIIDVLLRAETVRRMRAESGAPVASSSPASGQEIARLGEWLESLGFSPPPVPEELADFINTTGGEDARSGED